MGAQPAFVPPVPPNGRGAVSVALAFAITLVLCCGGGVIGVGGLFYAGYSSVRDEAVATVRTHLRKLANAQYAAAYDQLCQQTRDSVTLDEFTDVQVRAGQVLDFTVTDDVEVGTGEEWLVEATVRRAEHPARVEWFPLVFDEKQQARVCPTA